MYSQQESKEVSKVIEYHIECIYKSGLLLDEHDELLQEFLRLPQYPKPKLEILPFASILCGFCLTMRTKSFLPLIVSSIPFGVNIMNRFIAVRRCKAFNKNFMGLITCYRKIFHLNKSIIQYYHKKKVCLTKMDQSTRMLIESPVMLKLSEFIEDATKIMWDMVLCIKNKLCVVREIFDMEEFAYVYDLNIPENIKTCHTEEELIAKFETVQMCLMFAVSTILCGIGFCFSHIDFNNKKHLSLFSIIIPNCYAVTADKYQKICNKYEEITYRLPSVSVTVDKPIYTNNIPIQSALSNLNENIKLSFDTVTALQAEVFAGSDLDFAKFKHQLSDLDRLFAECSSTLTYLRYETTKSLPSSEGHIQIRNRSDLEDKILHVVRYDDVEDVARNEEYSLSIHGSDSDLSISEDEQSKLDYEQLRKQIRNQKLIIKELNDELKKRQLIKQIDVYDPKKHENSLPRNGDMPENTQMLTSLKIPPPPSFQSPTFFAEASTHAPPPKEFLEQIKAMAQSRGVEEVVFGEDTFSSDEDGSDI